jgi:2-polyprenyl-3-methyl-5-hydroxy-6-metoxy-1,4-benzoquinol methylase
MESDFKQAWNTFFATKRSAMRSEQADAHERFALTNRERARDFVKFLQFILQYDFKAKRILDVGSAYGGFLIESAKIGAEAYGIEIDQGLFDLGRANILNEDGKIVLVHGDVLEHSALKTVDDLPFDLIIVNDVFEHIYDCVSLMARIDQFSGPNSIVFFSIPNGTSYHTIDKEAHFFRFGLSLLEPADWSGVVGGFNVYYRALITYQLHLKAIGYPFLYLQIDEDSVALAQREIPHRFELLEQKINAGSFESAALNEKVKKQFCLLKQRLENDLKKENPIMLQLKYGQHFWTGFATRTANPILDSASGLVRLSLPLNGSISGEEIEARECMTVATPPEESCIDLRNARLETQNGQLGAATVGVFPSQSRFRFGFKLNNSNDPRAGDYTILRLPISVDGPWDQYLSLTVRNNYENKALTGRIDWSVFVNDILVHNEDIGLRGRPRRLTSLIRTSDSEVELKVVLRALRDCEPWHWGNASTTFVEFVTLQAFDAVVKAKDGTF